MFLEEILKNIALIIPKILYHLSPIIMTIHICDLKENSKIFSVLESH